MYDFVDRPITSLDPGGRFLIWTLRSWVKALAEGRCPAAAIGPAFAKWRMMTAFPPFHRMLTVLNAHGLQSFRVAPVGCRSVAEDEAVFLSLVNELGQAKPRMVRDTLALLVQEAHVGSMLAALSVLGAAMKEAGIFPGKPRAISGTSRGD